MRDLERLIREKRWTDCATRFPNWPRQTWLPFLIEVPDVEDVAIFRILPRESAGQVFAYLPLDHQEKPDSLLVQRSNAIRSERDDAG